MLVICKKRDLVGFLLAAVTFMYSTAFAQLASNQYTELSIPRPLAMGECVEASDNGAEQKICRDSGGAYRISPADKAPKNQSSATSDHRKKDGLDCDESIIPEYLKVQAKILGQNICGLAIYSAAAEAAGGNRAVFLNDVHRLVFEATQNGIDPGQYSDWLQNVNRQIGSITGSGAEMAKRQMIQELQIADYGIQNALLSGSLNTYVAEASRELRKPADSTHTPKNSILNESSDNDASSTTATDDGNNIDKASGTNSFSHIIGVIIGLLLIPTMTWIARRKKILGTLKDAARLLVLLVAVLWIVMPFLSGLDFEYKETLGDIRTITFLLACYFLPTILAFEYHRRNRNAIATLNALLGWTGLGWVLALVWFFMKEAKDQTE